MKMYLGDRKIDLWRKVWEGGAELGRLSLAPAEGEFVGLPEGAYLN